MLVIGVFQILLGIMALLRDEFFVATANYLYIARVYGWGWLHLGIGALLVLTGLFLYTGVMAIRVIGVALAAISAIANFLFIPYYPVWSLLIIGLDALLIWAITTGPQRMREAAAPGMAPGTAMSNPERWTATNESQPAGRPMGASQMRETARPEAARTEARTAGGSSGQTTNPPAGR